MPTTTLRRAPHITSLITIAALASFSTACFSPDEQATGDSSTGELSATASGTAPDASTATSGQTGPDTQSSGPETTDADDATESSGDNSDTTTSGSAEETTGAPDDDTTGEPDASSDDSSGTIVDSPSIVEVTPADGAIGVHADTTIVVQFSTEMDKASAQAAFQSADLPAAAVTFDWNDAGDQLTITPTPHSTTPRETRRLRRTR